MSEELEKRRDVFAESREVLEKNRLVFSKQLLSQLELRKYFAALVARVNENGYLCGRKTRKKSEDLCCLPARL